MTSPATGLDTQQQASLNALLYDAIRTQNLERVKLCLTRGAQAADAKMGAYFQSRHEDEMPLAIYAYRYYNGDIFEILAKNGMDLEGKDQSGYTALARAVRDTSPDRVQHLLALGSSPLSVATGGRTIIDLARDSVVSGREADREKVIDALLNALPQVKTLFNAEAAAPSASTVTTGEDLVVSRPLTLTPHKKDGLQL